MKKILRNGDRWLDTKGEPIHCHGGHIQRFDNSYYWYGEDRRGGAYVSCYTSKDLLNWEFCRHILTVHSKTDDQFGHNCHLLMDGEKVNIERPKVVYNKKTGKYVMWAHFENGRDYRDAAIALASCDRPDGEFVYHGSFRPLGNMSRDCNVFFENGNMYFASAANENEDLHIYEMNDTYTGVKRLVQKLFVGQSREAPVFFHLQGKTYVLTSQCTGWKPNQGGYAFANHMEGSWSEIFDFGNETTERSQPTCVLPFGNQYLYIGDRWGGSLWDGKTIEDFDYFCSSYYFGLIDVYDDGSIALIPCDEFTIDTTGFVGLSGSSN